MMLLGVLSRKKFAIMVFCYIVTIATYVYFFGRMLHRDALDDVQAMGTMVQAFIGLYGLLAGLTLVSLWGSFNELESHIRQEAGLLTDILQYSRSFGNETFVKVSEKLGEYLEKILGPELDAFKRSEPESTTGESFSKFQEFVSTIVKSDCKDLGMLAISLSMLSVLNLTSQQRNMRVSMSTSGMPKPMLYLVHFHAFVLLMLIFFTGFQHIFFGVLMFTVFSVALFMTYFAITELNNSFRGMLVVDNSPFRILLEKAKKSTQPEMEGVRR